MSSNTTGGRYGFLARIAFGFALLILGSQALAAGTAANTQLQNTVTVNFDNLAGVSQTAVTASVTITVNLVQAAPTIAVNSTSPSTLTNVSEGQVVTVNYQVTSNANGPDSYDLAVSETITGGFLSATGSTYGSLSTTAITGAIGTLGATTVGEVTHTFSNTAGAGADQCVYPGTDVCSVEVPNDDSNADSKVNGIAANAEVMINNGSTDLYCTVDSIDDANGGSAYVQGTTASHINVKNCYANAAQTTALGSNYTVQNGDSIYETTAVAVDYTLGNLTTGHSSDSTTISTDATTHTGGNASGAVTTAITVIAPDLVIHKFVRDVTTAANNPASCAATAYSCLVANGNTYYASGVTANPTDTLEYAVLVENQGGNVQNVVITDPLVTFTTYVAGTAGKVDAGTVAACAGGTCSVTTTGSFANVADDGLTTANDFGGISGGTVTIYAGVGGNEAGAAGTKGGAIAANAVSVGFYRVTVQ